MEALLGQAQGVGLVKRGHGGVAILGLVIGSRQMEIASGSWRLLDDRVQIGKGLFRLSERQMGNGACVEQLRSWSVQLDGLIDQGEGLLAAPGPMGQLPCEVVEGDEIAGV